jgi:hypothetical protein
MHQLLQLQQKDKESNKELQLTTPYLEPTPHFLP